MKEIQLSEFCYATLCMGSSRLIRVWARKNIIYLTFDEIQKLYQYALKVQTEAENETT